MNNKNFLFVRGKDETETEFEYIGAIKLLNIIIERIEKERDIKIIKEYSLIFKSIYSLIINK